MIRLTPFFVWLLLASSLDAETLYHDEFDRDGLTTNKGVGGGAVNQSRQSHVVSLRPTPSGSQAFDKSKSDSPSAVDKF